MLHTLGCYNFISETTSTKAEKEEIKFENMIERLFRNVFHMDYDPEDHLNEVNPKKGEIYSVNYEFNFVSLSLVVDEDVDWA